MDAAADRGQPGRKPSVPPAVFPSATAAGEEVNRDICREALLTSGLLRAPWLLRAFDAVEREAFVPQTFWLPVQDEDGLWTFVDRSTHPTAWQQAVWNPHQSVVTQLDDGGTPPGPSAGTFTSSVSALDIVMRKLAALDLESGHTVLEIGTGSGYHTALLSERVGGQRVTTVEIDAYLAATAATTLKSQGYEPVVIAGDGLLGAPGQAPFDRVISTAAVRRIPRAWVEQTHDGGKILTPFGTAYSNAGLLDLTLHDNLAQGRFIGSAAYMWVRADRPSVDLHVPQESRTRRSPVDPNQVLSAGHLQDFAIGLQVPDVSYSYRGEGADRRVQFVDEAGTSATIVRYADWWEGDAVTSWGPRDLWAEVTAAFSWYEHHDSPHITRFGVTSDSHHEYAWLDDPSRTVGDG
ncbi:protein-L-isoaspartate(D-aspartate) O-methyltransferase [Streptomyces sp. 3211.6]|uniref:protein-L-isoaspartate O-methyltransferase family protein n=1 Tax=Streptomyces sp. 3211.6 TaxID=1938845 RepID=UPI000F166427|nr:methyltransferase domain-containing protein [Streptomyces sp. 3211.6]RKT05305.1 protein-L-isoaspartate(D-aspartate) O-methyltransferase [Streptomyces sp. 3211.6]